MKYITILLLTATIAHAELIPADTLIPWTPGVTVGVQGGVTNRTTPVFNVVNYGADPTGVNSSSTAVANATAACPAGGVVYFPAGTYLLPSIMSLKANVTFRGAGMNVTTLKGVISQAHFTDNTGPPPWGFWSSESIITNSASVITAGLTKGSTVLTVNNTAPFTVGKVLLLYWRTSTDQFASPFVWGPGGASWMGKQHTKLISKTATTLTIFPAVYFDFSSHTARVTQGVFDDGGMGLEDLTVDAVGNTRAIFLEEIHNSWLKNVKIKNYANRGIWMQNCIYMEVFGCWVDGGADLSTGGSNHAGIQLDTIGASLFYNNIVYNNFHSLQVNGSSGNVFAYNFHLNPNGLAEIDCNHNPHPICNLYEGNVATNIVSDGYYGSESNSTVFRNWLTAAPPAYYAYSLKRFTREHAFVGNVVGYPGYLLPGFPAYLGISFGQPQIGNPTDNGLVAPPWADFPTTQVPDIGYQEFDSGVEASLTRKGNYFFRTGLQDSLGGDTLPNSMYLSAKPAWFGNLTWPPVNPAAPGTPTMSEIYQKIPAGYRYVNGVDPPGVGGPDTTPPVLSGKVINAIGTQLALSFNETVSIGLGGNGGWTLNMTGGAVTVTGAPVVSGSTITWNLSRTIGAGQTGTVSYVQPGNGVEDVAGNDLASLSNSAVTNTAAGDTVAPIPNPSTFGIAPSALTSSTITMTATTATDAGTPPVQYFFNETSGNAGGSDSGWQSSSTFTDTGLAAGTQYSYRVQTRDSATTPNVTTFSGTFSATTKSVAGAHPAMPFNMARANIVTP